MRIRETFATAIQERIEPVVKVRDRRPSVLLGELQNLVVTPQWEKYLHLILDAYSDAADREDEQGIGIWISGFFGSGKSLLMKIVGLLLEGGELGGKDVHEQFLTRLSASSPDSKDLERFLTVCRRKVSTTVVGGNLHSMQTSANDSLALIAFRLFAGERGFTHNWPFAWAVEYQIDERGLTPQFRQRASDICGLPWEDLADDPDFYFDQLCQAAADTLSDHFTEGAASVQRAVNAAVQSGVTPDTLVRRLKRWCEARDGGGRRHKLLLELDELGQWIAAYNPNGRTMEVQVLAETAGQLGDGRIWVAVTAHGDIQQLQSNMQQTLYAQIAARFAQQCKLSNEDISKVVETRLLLKTQDARKRLTEDFERRSGELADLGSLQKAQRVYPAPDRDRFPLFYPYMPWTVTIIPDVIKGIAQAAGRGDALTGATRSMLGVVQGAIIDTPGLLDRPLGRLLSLADLYDQLATDIAVETKTDLSRIQDSVPGSRPMTVRTARALYLLGEAEYVPTTLDNVTRALADSLDANLALLGKEVETELNRLIEAGYVKSTGDQYVFLTTQQRSFQDKVRARQEELLSQSYELSQALAEYDSDEALRFDRVAVQGVQGREMLLRLELDGRVVRNRDEPVAVRVYSPMQRSIDPQITSDAYLQQLSAQESNNVFLRMADVPGFRSMLALAIATNEVAERVISAGQPGNPEADVARQARLTDLATHRAEVHKLLSQALRNGAIFFRGSQYSLAPGESVSASIRATLSQLLPVIYPRYSDVPQRIGNEDAAVKAALQGNSSNADLYALGVFRSDGSINESHPLLSTLRGHLPLFDQGSAPVNADSLRQIFVRPPYGWDGNAIKVGLALLLRASACRLIENAETYTDPTKPEVIQLLTKEARFKNVRVQGIGATIDIATLRQVREQLERVFGLTGKPALVADTLNNVLGEKLDALWRDDQALQSWASTAQCPLPVEFESGSSLVEEMRGSALPQVRLPRFLEQAETLMRHTDLLKALASFRQEQAQTFQRLRDFFQSVVYADIDLPQVRQFIMDWRTVAQQERSITDGARWNELVQSYHGAQQAITDQVATWQADAEKRLEDLQAHLEQRVRATGVPEDKVPEETAKLSAPFADVKERLARAGGTGDIAETKRILTALSSAELSTTLRLRELQTLYRVEPPDGAETLLHWRDLLGETRISVSSVEEFDRAVARARDAVRDHLNQSKTLVIE